MVEKKGVVKGLSLDLANPEAPLVFNVILKPYVITH
jgi:hypothetical protein